MSCNVVEACGLKWMPPEGDCRMLIGPDVNQCAGLYRIVSGSIRASYGSGCHTCCKCIKQWWPSWNFDGLACVACKNRQREQQTPQAPPASAAAAPAGAASNEAARLIQDATARAEQITADAQANADRITTAARADAQRSAGAAQAEAQRITADARAATQAEAQRITADARAAAQAEAQRITADARAAAQSRSGPGERGLNAHESGRTSVVIFFNRELAAATAGFAGSHCIGRGGFGSVFFTAQLRGMGGADLAIKKLDLESMQGQTEFLQEVQVLGSCRHVNLTPLVGFAADVGGVCLVTPLMKGGNLEDRLLIQDVTARQRLSKLPGAPAGGFEPLSWQERLTVAVDVVTGLLYLHTPDPHTHKPTILHRDMKPSNVLLDLDKRGRLADMGLARAQRPGATHLTTSTTIAGTIGYLDEFYQNGGRFDEKADGYAVGVTLLVLLTGRPAVVEGEHIIGRCEVDDVSLVADERAQWPSAVAQEVLKVGMDLVKRNRSMRITLSTALQRLEQLVDANPAPALEPEVVVERECMMCLSAPRHVRFGW